MAKPYIIGDAGHGIDTRGKRSIKTPGEYQLMEWQFNRIMRNKFHQRCYDNQIAFDSYPNTESDVPVRTRAARINTIYNRNKHDHFVFGISFHGNAFKEEKAMGSEVFTFVGQTESDVIAEYVCKEFQQSEITKFRPDLSDGDLDKEAKFIILGDTICPFILVEFGFYTNDGDRLKMFDNDWQEDMTLLTFNGVKNYIKERL